MREDPNRLPFVDFENLDHHLRTLAVDISLTESVNGNDHQGIKAAQFVENSLIQYPILTPVCLMLKKLLIKNDFNDPYYGGLGSFSLFLMLYAAYFIENLNAYEGFHSEDTHPARLFAWFLAYFGDYFDISKMAIIFMKGEMPLTILKSYCGQTEEREEVRLWVLDPNNSTNNTTAKVWRIMEIRSMFSDTKKKIFREYVNIFNSTSFDEELTILDKIL